MDLLNDATRGSANGAAQLANRGLLYWLIDEVTAAQFLARQSHATLAYRSPPMTRSLEGSVRGWYSGKGITQDNR